MNDSDYIPPSEREIIKATGEAGGWNGPLDMESDLLRHADVVDDVMRDLADSLNQLMDDHQVHVECYCVPNDVCGPCGRRGTAEVTLARYRRVMGSA